MFVFLSVLFVIVVNKEEHDTRGLKVSCKHIGVLYKILMWFTMEGEDIIEHTNVRCHLYTI